MGKSKSRSPEAACRSPAYYHWLLPILPRSLLATATSPLLARSCQSGMSVKRSLSREKRTSSDRSNSVAIDPQRPFSQCDFHYLCHVAFLLTPSTAGLIPSPAS